MQKRENQQRCEDGIVRGCRGAALQALSESKLEEKKNEGLREDGLWVGLNSVLKWRYRMDWGFSGKNCGWPGAYGRHSVSRGGITVGQ